MLDGCCPKCQRAEVRERVARLPAPQKAKPALRVRLLVCAACGYTELWTPGEQLGALADSAEWVEVAPAAAEPAGNATVRLDPAEPRAYTGTTDRLVLPTGDLAAGLEPKRRCPSCLSEKLIAAVPLADQALSVAIERSPASLLFRSWATSTFRVWICGECGYTSIFATDPAELYAAYQAAQ